MKPVAILRFSGEDGPGYFASFLDRHSIPWRLFAIDAGDGVPADMAPFSGLVLMGGPMSVNDPLPWIPPVLSLVRDAIAHRTPCLGHCLGGQLMSKALGGAVTRNPVKEIGWNPVTADNSSVARQWLGDALFNQPQLEVFQWHGETFSLPPGASRILTGLACVNQAFVVGNSLAMQCHTEMTPAMIAQWCLDWEQEQVDAALPSIQRPDEILRATETGIDAMRQLSDRLYTTWISGLPGRPRI